MGWSSHRHGKCWPDDGGEALRISWWRGYWINNQYNDTPTHEQPRAENLKLPTHPAIAGTKISRVFADEAMRRPLPITDRNPRWLVMP